MKYSLILRKWCSTVLTCPTGFAQQCNCESHPRQVLLLAFPGGASYDLKLVCHADFPLCIGV